ncbi:MAG TPA: outer membrane protein assembly factor BamA [Piscirickettsiaceae bacterium]|nr:outer membrane protein assembly factor BamA [Piscirickettsiaceae bacterium]
MVDRNFMTVWRAVLVGVLLALSGWVQAAFAPFKVDAVKIVGAQRISHETIRSYLTIGPGQQLTPQQAQMALKTLYATGFFKTAALFRDGHTLIVKVVERPTIAEIKIEGNDLISTEDLKKGLEVLGITKGRIYSLRQLERIVQDLRQRYQNLGYYGATIQVETHTLPRNRVALLLKIHEGAPATIGRIAFVGNKAFSDQQLLRLMMLQPGEQYDKAALQGDLDKIQRYYMDRGFAEFTLRSTQVRLAPDRQRVYITINLHEGPVYRIGKVDLQGDLKLPEAQLKALLEIKTGQRFSRQAIIDTVNALKDHYSEHAYANAQVIPRPKLDKEKRIADMAFWIDTGARVYVRRIQIKGNTRTRDHVVRRELRQLESAPYSLTLVELSKRRLQKLGYFKRVDIRTQPIAPDLVDLVVEVEEQPTGSFTASVGYSQLQGVTFSLGVAERNVLGSGNTANIKVSTNNASKTLDVTLVNPYFTPNGVSLGVGAFWREVNADELYIANYTLNTLGGTVFSSIPLSEHSQFNYGVKIKRDTLVCGENFQVCTNFVAEHDDQYLTPLVNLGWRYNTTNAFYFPTEGRRLSVSAEAVLPIATSLGYGKLTLSGSHYFPLTTAFTLKSALDVAWGTGYGDLNSLPFFERFYAGGIRSVRGFEPNSLGEHYDLATDGTDVAKGGDLRITGTFALISPFPFIEDSSNLRVSLFVDYGYVYPSVDQINWDQLRVSAGFMLNWITPVGPLALSFASPVRYGDNDKLQSFQFSLGMPF